MNSRLALSVVASIAALAFLAASIFGGDFGGYPDFSGQGMEFKEALKMMNPLAGALALYILALASFAASILFVRKIAVFRYASLVFLFLAVCAHFCGIFERIFWYGTVELQYFHTYVVVAGLAGIFIAAVFYGKRRAFVYIPSSCMLGILSLGLGLALSSNAVAVVMGRWLVADAVIMSTGFSAVFLACFLSWVRLVSNVFSRVNFGIETAKTAQSVYYILCIGLVFCVAGIMIGGIWHDLSFGNFFGWTRGEIGLLMIIFWCAFIVHCRYLKFAGDRAFLSLAVFGGVVAAWGWFGVRMVSSGQDAPAAGWAFFAVFVLGCLAAVPLFLVKYKAPAAAADNGSTAASTVAAVSESAVSDSSGDVKKL